MKKSKIIASVLVLVMFVCLAASLTANAAEVTFKTVSENGKIYGIPANSTCAVLNSSFYNTIIDVYDLDGSFVSKASSTRIGTGFEIRINAVPYTAVVLGDINGDGKSDATDYSLIKRAYLETLEQPLDSLALEAAGLKSDEVISPVTYLKIKRSVLGTYNINIAYTCDPYDPAIENSGWTSGWV